MVDGWLTDNINACIWTLAHLHRGYPHRPYINEMLRDGFRSISFMYGFVEKSWPSRLSMPYLPSSLATYALKVSSQSGAWYPAFSILAIDRAECVGRGLTGAFAFAKYSSVEIGRTLSPLPLV